MKRKVRIYKDPNGKGGYINKTAQWLRKAETGTEAGTPVTAGIMQQMQAAQPQQMQQQSAQQQEGDIMLQETTQMISRGMDKEDIKAQLLAKYSNYEAGTPEYADADAQVDQYLENVYDQLGETAREETNENLELEDADEYQNPEVEETTNPNYYYDLAQEDSADSDMEEDYSFGNLKYGGIPNKRSFVNKTIRQLRKAQKGDQVEEANVANVRGTEDNPTTPPGNKNPFIAGVKDQAQNHFLQQQAEQMYDAQFGQGTAQPQDNMDFAQFGGMRMRRANRRMFGTPFAPPGVTSSKYSFGPLGGVRSAEVQFNPLMMASMFPMNAFPGMGGYNTSWSGGYNTQPYRKTTPGRLVTEAIATTVNNESTEDVEDATDSDAAKTSTEPKKEEVTTTDVVTTDTQPKRSSYSKPVVRDQWGRAEDNEWYGHDPAADSAGKDQWGRKEGSKYYGHDPSKDAGKDRWGRPRGSKWYNYHPKSNTWLGGVPKWAQGKAVGIPDFGMAFGGMVNNPMQDQYGDLQRFIYGGDDDMNQVFLQDLYQPPINQSDLDYTDSKDATDPYFRDGGLYAFDGEGDSETNPTNTVKTYNQEELDKIIADRQKTWETEYQNKIRQQYPTRDNFSSNYYPGGYGSSGVGQPVWGYQGGYGGFGGRGMLGAFGNLYSPFTRGASNFSPFGNPLQYAATAAGITKAGMLPTGMKYSKERKQDGNWFEKNLGFNKDRVWTIDYATPEQIKAGAKPGTTTPTTTPTTTTTTTPSTTKVNDKARNVDQYGLNRKLNFPGEDKGNMFTNMRINAAERRAGRQDQRAANRDLRTGDILKFPGPDMSNMQDMEEPKGPIDITTAGQTDPRFGYSHGGYIPDYMAYGGYLPQAGPGIDVSSVSFAGNPVVGLEPSSVWSDMTSFGTNQNIKNLEADQFETYTAEPDDLKDCTYEQKLDTTSKCYDPQTAQLKIKEEKSGTINWDNISRGALDAGANIADAKDYLNQYRTNYIPGMTEFARGEKQTANQGINRGMWKSYSGEEGDPKSFKDVIKKGGAIKSKKSIASGHKIDMNDFQSLLKLAGLI